MPASIFAAGRDQLNAKLAESGPGPSHAQFRCSALDHIKVATLHTICLGADLDDIAAVNSRCPTDAIEAEPEGPWIFPFPAEIVEHLASLDGPGRAAMARAWGETEEWGIGPREMPGFAAWFSEFCGFCQQQRAAGRAGDLWVWLSM